MSEATRLCFGMNIYDDVSLCKDFFCKIQENPSYILQTFV